MSCDLELEIVSTGAPGVFRVDADSPAGTATRELRLDTDALLARRRELAASVLASAVRPARGLTEQERPIREMGRALFDALFAERIYGRYTASVQEAARRGEPLRVVLRLRAPELAGLPWETLFDAEVDEYVCQREPVVRYVETAQAVATLRADPPLRILGLVASPHDLAKLDIAEERRRLSDALAGLGGDFVELVWAQGGSWPELQELLVAGPWHIVHFVGHGGVDEVSDGGVLWLEEEATGLATSVSAARFSRLLHSCRPVPRLVVLNSCRTGEAAADDLLSSTAAALVHSGISAVVAMQFAITDPAALAFARGFYQGLARNEPVDEAVRLGRIAIDGTGERTLEWVTPVLYLRTDETRLFAITSRREAVNKVGALGGEQAAHEAALHGLYVQALAALRTGRDDEAIVLLDSLLTLNPGYRDAKERRDAARRSRELAAGYQRGRRAEDAHNWADAVREYTALAQTDPGYRDAADRRDHCRRQQQITSLKDELRLHGESRNWEAVIAVSAELSALDPEASDVDGLATTARQHLEGQRREAEKESEREAEQSGHEAEQPPRTVATGAGEATVATARAAGAIAVVGALVVTASTIPSGPIHLQHGWKWYVGGVVLMAAVVIALIGFGVGGKRAALLVPATGVAFVLLGEAFPLSWSAHGHTFPSARVFWIGVCGAAVAAFATGFAAWLTYREASQAPSGGSSPPPPQTTGAVLALVGPLIVIASFFLSGFADRPSTWKYWSLKDPYPRYPLVITVICAVLIALAASGILLHRRRQLVIAAATACFVLGEVTPLLKIGYGWREGTWLGIIGAVAAVTGLALALGAIGRHEAHSDIRRDLGDSQRPQGGAPTGIPRL